MARYHDISTWVTSRVIVAVLACLVGSAGCGGTADDRPTGPRTGTGTIRALIADAPFPFESVARVDVFVVRVDAMMRPASPGEEHAGVGLSPGQDPRQGWIAIATPNRAYDLMQLRNGVSAPLGESRVPSGTYRALRLVLDTEASSVTLRDGTVLTGSSDPGIQWPSAGSVGLRVELAGGVPVLRETSTDLLVDFDVGESFVLRGNSIAEGGLLFRPVLRGVGVAGP